MVGTTKHNKGESVRGQMPRVSVVIPNFNGMPHLPDCLDSLQRQAYRDFVTVVVDNASEDGSCAWVRAHHPEVQVIPLPTNRGFAHAVNHGIRSGRTEYVALLNNDTVVDRRWLCGLVGELDATQKYDFAASKMILHDGSDRLNAAGDDYSVMRLAGRNRGIGHPAWRFSRPERVLGACAGAAMYRRRLFDEVGLFDEDFFLISEDTDFNLRCLIAGKRCIYVPEAVVWHKLRASISLAPDWEMRRMGSRNDAMVAAKDLPLAVLLCPLPWLWRTLRQTVLLRRSNWHLVPIFLKETPARTHAELEGLRMGWRKRHGVWSLRRTRRLEILRWLIWGHGPA
jgi:GT2 family glycosyltransferase